MSTVCIKCGRTDADRPCGKYCGDGSDKDNGHDWRLLASLSVDETDRVSKVRARRVEEETAHRMHEERYENRIRIEGAKAERRAVLLRVAGECREEADAIQSRTRPGGGIVIMSRRLGAAEQLLKLAAKYEREAAEVSDG